MDCNIKSLPDYIGGRLLFYDEFSDDNMRYVVYDGYRKIRFISRKAAEKWIMEQVTGGSQECVECAMIAQMHLDRAWRALHNASNHANNADLKIQFESYSVNTRRICDETDKIISQIIVK